MRKISVSLPEEISKQLDAMRSITGTSITDTVAACIVATYIRDYENAQFFAKPVGVRFHVKQVLKERGLNIKTYCAQKGFHYQYFVMTCRQLDTGKMPRPKEWSKAAKILELLREDFSIQIENYII